jgi:hypothetical protein
MIMAGTLTILALWLAFVWFVDPDGYRNARRQSATGGTVHPHKNALNAGQLKIEGTTVQLSSTRRSCQSGFCRPTRS